MGRVMGYAKDRLIRDLSFVAGSVCAACLGAGAPHSEAFLAGDSVGPRRSPDGDWRALTAT